MTDYKRIYLKIKTYPKKKENFLEVADGDFFFMSPGLYPPI